MPIPRDNPWQDIQRILARALKQCPSFSYQGQALDYAFALYNNFGLNERSIEIPIVRYWLDKGDYTEALEIGNVSNYYYRYFQDTLRCKVVVDKNERACGVINKDIADYDPGRKFDFIFSISTFEHMDADRGRNAAYKPGQSRLKTQAADNIKHVGDAILAPGGRFVVTFPAAYEPQLDESVHAGDFEKCGFSQVHVAAYKKRAPMRWEEISLDEARSAEYNAPLPAVNVLYVAVFTK